MSKDKKPGGFLLDLNSLTETGKLSDGKALSTRKVIEAEPVNDLSVAEIRKLAWGKACSWTKSNMINANAANVAALLMQHPAWAGKLGYNLRAQSVEWIAAPELIKPFKQMPIGEVDESEWVQIQHWLAAAPIHMAARKDFIHDGILAGAKQNCFDPVINYFESLRGTWDGKPRIDEFGIRVLGAEDNIFTREAFRKLFTMALRRTYQPGCDARHMVVLEGVQGLGKTSCMQDLMPPQGQVAHGGRELLTEDCKIVLTTKGQRPWVVSLPAIEIDPKNSAERLRGSVFVEFGEMGMLTTKANEVAKAFISETADNYRPAYARKAASFPRSNVFYGTSNNSEWQRDRTGGDRYWPIFCHGVGGTHGKGAKRDFEYPKVHRDQIWAEALQVYFDTPSAKRDRLTQLEQPQATLIQREVVEERHIEAPWEELLDEFLHQRKTGTQGKQPFLSVEIRTHVTDTLPNVHDLDRRIASELKSRGFEKKGVRDPRWNDESRKAWVWPEIDQHETEGDS